MPTDAEFQQLKDQVAALASQLTAARNRIADLEDSMGDHLGLDWGESLVDVNSPHPNMSINTGEFGGGAMRLDALGIQINTPDGTKEFIAVPRFMTTAELDTFHGPWLRMKFSLDTATPSALWSVRSESQSGRTGTITLNVDDAEGYFKVDNKLALWLEGRTSDPSTLQDGEVIYRSDTFKFRGVANGVAANFLLEGDTTALTADISPSQITSNQDDYSPTGLSTATILRLNTDASRDITGITGGADGRILLIFNVGSFNIVLKDDVTSTAENRFALNGDLTLQPDNSVGLWYDSTSSRWRAF